MLEVRSLTKRFGGLVAVDHMDMQVYPGEVVGLLGDNGAGKSTLIKMVSGVYHPDEGRIFFQGKEVKMSTPMDALDLGIETLYQDLALAQVAVGIVGVRKPHDDEDFRALVGRIGDEPLAAVDDVLAAPAA